MKSLPGKDFVYEGCRRRILSVRLPGDGDGDGDDEEQRLLKISGLVDLESVARYNALLTGKGKIK